MNPMKKLLLLTLMSAALHGAPALAAERAETALAQATQAFQAGSYVQVLNLLQSLKAADMQMQSRVEYLLARTQTKLQNYAQAARHYRNAEQLGDRSPALQYELGQALYAAKDLRGAREAFKKSIVAKYKIGASAYYIAFTSQLLEDYDTAYDYYGRIQRLSSDPDQVQQPALYQMAEIAYARAEGNAEQKSSYYAKNVLPLYKNARAFGPGTATGKQAHSRVLELTAIINGDAKRMRNGMPIPRQPYALKLSLDSGWNSNVITQADQAIVEVSNQDSFFSRLNVLTKYQWDFWDTFSVLPEFSSTMQLHWRRNTPLVYQNDNVIFAPAVRTKFEHWIGSNPATMLFDIEYNYMLRDYLQKHTLPYYSRHWNFTLGERAKIFPFGSTTLKANIKFYENYNPDRNSISPGFSLTQNIRIGENDFSQTVSGDYLRARNDVNDEANLKFRSSMEFTDAWGQVDLTPSLTWALKDTMKQKGTRGVEVLLNPAITADYDWNEQLSASLAYGFTKNISRAKTTYQYTQHEFTAGAEYNF